MTDCDGVHAMGKQGIPPTSRCPGLDGHTALSCSKSKSAETWLVSKWLFFVILLINDTEYDVSGEGVTSGEGRFEGLPLVRLRRGLRQVSARVLSYLMVPSQACQTLPPH